MVEVISHQFSVEWHWWLASYGTHHAFAFIKHMAAKGQRMVSNKACCHWSLKSFPAKIQVGMLWLTKESTMCPWASCQIRKIAGAHAPGMPGTFSPSPQVSDPDMHHGTCVTHVPWCMPGSLTIGFFWNRRRGKTFPAFPAHAQPAILRIW